MTEKALILSWPHDWSFVQGTPTPGWEKSYKEGKLFHLDACINLDKLCDAPVVPGQSEGVLYARFATKTAGSVLLGMSCNWNFTACCDGETIFATGDGGNGYTYVFPNNHRVSFDVSEGEHLLAFHVRRGQDAWDFTCCPVSPDVPEEPAITYGPWLTNPDAGKMTVAFSCNQPLGAAIAIHKKGEDAWQLTWHHRQGQCIRRTYHAIPLEGLQHGAIYEYRIVVIHPDNFCEVPLGKIHSFRVPDASSSRFSFFFTADLQFGLKAQQVILDNMLNAANADSCDFFVLDGDVNSAFLPENVICGPFAQLCEHNAAEKPIIYVRGNHELRGGNGDRFLDFFATNIGTTYDVVRLGDTAFLLLDSWEDKPAKTPGHDYCQWNLDDWFINTETQWLAKAMEDPKWTSAKRRIVICHGAPYSHYDSCLTIPFVLQKMTDPYFEGAAPKSPLNLWLAGHVHHYLRSVPGTDDIASTDQPRPPFKSGQTYTYPVLTVAGPWKLAVKASCFRIDADDDGFDVRSWDDQGHPLEHVRYANDGTCTEYTSLPHFTVKPSLP